MLAGWAATWLGLSMPPGVTTILATAAALFGIVGMTHAHRHVAAHPAAPEPWASAVCTLLLVSAGLALSAAVHVATASSGPVPGLAAQSAFVGTALTVTGDPRRVDSRPQSPSRSPSGSASAPDTRPAELVLLPVRMTEVTTGGGQRYETGASVTVLVKPRGRADFDAWMALLPSEHLRLSGKLEPPRGGTRDAALLLARGQPDVVGGPSIVQTIAGGLRADLRDAASTLPAEEAGFLPAVAVGDTSREPTELNDALKRTGLTYITVASGENLVFAATALLPVARWVGFRGRAVTGSAVIVVLGFTLLARPGPPMVRATVMSLLGCVASATGRRVRALTTMSAAVLVLLLVDPWLARSYGFALSAAATAGLLVVAPIWCGALLDRGVPPWIAGPAATTAAAELFCEPVLVLFSGSLPLIAVPANILAVPAAPAATVLGIGAMAADAVWPPLGHAVAWVAQWPVRWICLVARGAAAIPGASIGWPTGIGGCALLLGCYVAGRRLLVRRRHRSRAGNGGSPPQTSTGLDRIGLMPV